MLVLTNESFRKISVCEDGEELFKATLEGVANYLVEERPEDVEAHIFNGAQFISSLPESEDESLRNLLNLRFQRENNVFYQDE